MFFHLVASAWAAFSPSGAPLTLLSEKEAIIPLQIQVHSLCLFLWSPFRINFQNYLFSAIWFLDKPAEISSPVLRTKEIVAKKLEKRFRKWNDIWFVSIWYLGLKFGIGFGIIPFYSRYKQAKTQNIAR